MSKKSMLSKKMGDCDIGAIRNCCGQMKKALLPLMLAQVISRFKKLLCSTTSTTPLAISHLTTQWKAYFLDKMVIGILNPRRTDFERTCSSMTTLLSHHPIVPAS
jgi:hypothetical protein